MRIDVVNNAEGYSEERLASLDGYIVRLSEAVLSGDYSSPQVTRSLKDAYATLTFVTSDEIREVNLEQREIDKETDCLSFPMLELKDGSFEMIPDSGDFETDEEGNQVLCFGDILINPFACEVQAESYGHSFEREAMFLIAHSLLHLLGYDHIDPTDEKIMSDKQKRLMRDIGLAFDDELEDICEMDNHRDNAGASEGLIPAGTPCKHCGTVALLGRPNVGKSTLLNYITGMKIAIVSHKPQTTRTNIRTIYNTEDTQIIFTDTPGIHKPTSKMGEFMVDRSYKAALGADCVVLIADGRFPDPGAVEKKLMALLKESGKKVILAINKYDEAGQEKLLPLTQKYSELYDFVDIVPLSAKTGRNVDLLLSVITKMLPEGPRLYDSEYMTDQTERVIAAELIREQVLHYTDQEIPHGTAVIINEFKEKNDDGEVTSDDDRTIAVIKADIICNRDSHKAIIIGRDGQMIKRIGTAARRNIEKMLGCKVYLDLYVKVRNDWQNNDAMLGSTGLGKDIDE
ncbi:MAG: GTPase Era [Clostridiales bacterium]|nr:GTPase Era [Clostridiales bacterium]